MRCLCHPTTAFTHATIRSASTCVVDGRQRVAGDDVVEAIAVAFDRHQLMAGAPAAGDLARQLRAHHRIVIGKDEQRRYADRLDRRAVGEPGHGSQRQERRGRISGRPQQRVQLVDRLEAALLADRQLGDLLAPRQQQEIGACRLQAVVRRDLDDRRNAVRKPGLRRSPGRQRRPGRGADHHHLSADRPADRDRLGVVVDPGIDADIFHRRHAQPMTGEAGVEKVCAERRRDLVGQRADFPLRGGKAVDIDDRNRRLGFRRRIRPDDLFLLAGPDALHGLFLPRQIGFGVGADRRGIERDGRVDGDAGPQQKGDDEHRNDDQADRHDLASHRLLPRPLIDPA